MPCLHWLGILIYEVYRPLGDGVVQRVSLPQVACMAHEFLRVPEVGWRAYVDPCAVYGEIYHPFSGFYRVFYQVGGIGAASFWY